MPSIVVPEGYSYVLAAATSAFWLNVYQTVNVGQARKAAGVKYPNAYAEKAEADSSPAAMKFNCAQRAHQNTLEAVPTFLFLQLFAGLKYPYFAAGLGAAWVAGRVIYTMGYSTGDPAKRNTIGGPLSSLAYAVLGFTSTYVAFELITAGL